MMRLWNWQFIVSLGLLSATLSSFAPAQDAAPAEEVQPKTSPTKDSPLLVEPRSAETLFDAVVLMTDLARPGLAKAYLEKLMESKLDDETLLKLRDKHGAAMFLRLSNDKQLHPESVTLQEQVNSAFRKGTLDPSRVDKLITQLGRSAAEREVAILQLRNAGTFGAVRVIAALNSSKEDAQRKVLLYTLTRLNREVVPVLIGAVESPNPELNAVVIEALGWLGDRQATISLWHPAFSANQSSGVTLAARQALARIVLGNVNRSADVTQFGAVAELAKSARQHIQGTAEWALNDDDQVELWQWDAEAGTVAMSPLSTEVASMIVGTRHARQAFELSPQRSELHALYWVSLMASELQDAGRETVIATDPASTFHLGLQLGPDIMQRALTESMNRDQPIVAVVALQALAQTGSSRLLKASEGQVAPVVAALNHPDTRVQFAAASTVLTWNPATSFRGASRVVDVLARSLNDSGTVNGVAIDANEQRATSMSSALRDMGFDPLVASTGQDGFKLGTERGDVGLFLIEANVARWELSQTIANLRSDARTALIPIVVYGDEGLRARVERLADKYPRVRFVQQASSSEDMTKQIAPFLRSVQANSITQPQRVATRKASLNWLTQLADRQRASLFDLKPAENALFEATNDNDLAEAAVFSLGAIASPSAQTKLFEIAIAAARPAPVRDRALVQLAAHMQRFGVLLTETQTLELKKSAQQETDAGLKSAFAAVFGTLNPDPQQAAALLKSATPKKSSSK